MGLDMTAWGLFIAGLINQMGRVMIPAVKTTIMADPVLGGGFKEQVGAWLSAVSLVCLAGKLLGTDVRQRLVDQLRNLGCSSARVLAGLFLKQLGARYERSA